MSAATIRDSVTGAKVAAVRDAYHVLVVDDGVSVLHLSRSAALELARQLTEAANA